MKARAKDINDAVSAWSEPLQVFIAKTSFILGRITNLVTEDDVITFEAVNIRAIKFFPFSFNPYTSGETITISKDYIGLVGTRFIFALCDAVIEET